MVNYVRPALYLYMERPTIKKYMISSVRKCSKLCVNLHAGTFLRHIGLLTKAEVVLTSKLRSSVMQKGAEIR